MTFHGLPREQTHSALNQLQQALFHHEQWCEALHTTLICSQVPDSRDLDQEAHHKCRFGQWLYGAGSKFLASYPALAQIEGSHKKMHDCARELLRASVNETPIPLEDYQRFTTALKQMRLEVSTTKHELEESISNLDPLTGAAGRTAMLTKLREQHALAARKVHSTCVAMADLDNFKSINDHYGHAAGDEALVSFTRRVMSRIRPYDMLFRYGGEEFLLCAPAIGLEAAYAMIERLREDIAAMEITSEFCPPFKISVSFGVAPLDPDVPVEQSIERADKALYAAKAAGRNRTMAWSPNLA